MATFNIGPAPDAETLDALLDAVQPPQPIQVRSASMRKMARGPGSAFARSELTKLTQNQSLVNEAGQRFRPLDSWLVEPSRFADGAGDERGIRVRVRNAGLVVEVPRRPFDDTPGVLPLDGDDAGGLALSATLRLIDAAGAVNEHAMAVELDAESGRLHIEIPFQQPELRFAAFDAVNEGRASIALVCAHAIPVKDALPGIVPLVVRPMVVRPMVVQPMVVQPIVVQPMLLGTLGTRLLPAIVRHTQLNRTKLTIAPKGTAALPLQVTGAASCDVSVTWSDAQVTLQATLTAPDGSLRARAAGTSPLSLEFEIDAAGAAGQGGWTVSIDNQSARKVSCTAAHNLPRRRAKVTRVLDAAPAPGGVPAVVLRRFAQPGVLVRPVVTLPATPVMELMPDAATKVTVPARGHVEKLFSGAVPRRIVEARGTWSGQQHLTMEISGPDNKVLARAASGSGAWLRVKLPDGAVRHRVSIRNHGAQPLQVNLGHTPSTLSDRAPQPQNQPSTVRHEVRLEIRLELPRASHGWVYPDAESDETWQPVALGVVSQTVHVRASSDVIGQYFFLPEEFRLGFMADSTLPALVAELTRDEGADSEAVDGGYRIEATLVAVPWTSPARREALRDHLQKSRDLPFCALALASGLPARLQLLDAGSESADVTVLLDRGLVLPLEMPARRYNLLATMLQSAAGVGGAVVVTLPDGGELPIPLRLSLSAIAVNSVQLQISGTSAGANAVQLTNQCDEPVTMEGVNVWRVRSGSIGYHDAANVGSIASLPLASKVVTDLPLAASPRPGLDDLLVELGEATIAGVSAAHWLERIHRHEASLPSSELTVQAIGSPELVAAGFAGIKLQLTLPGGHPGAAAFIPAEQNQWKTSLVHELGAYAAGSAGLDGVVAEYQASFASGEGLPQRVPVTGPVLVVRAPGAEQAGSHYEISVLDGQEQVVRTEVHPREAMAEVLAALREQGLLWRLRVVAAPAPPDDPDPVEPVASDPVTDPAQPGDPIVVVARLLDFEKLARVFITLTPDDGSAGSEVMSLTSAGEMRWQPIQGRAAPFSWEASFIFKDGASRTLSGSEAEPLLVLDMPG
jgi:hypothetical protein